MPQLEMTHNDTATFLREATAEVFATMLDIQVTPGEPFVEDVLTSPRCGVVALIGFAGTWIGTGITRCDAATACDLYSRMLMTPTSVIDKDVLDAFGEVANMIVGNFKTSMEAVVGQMGMSIPTIFHGTDFTSSTLQAAGLVMPFTWDDRKLEVKICIMPKERRQNLAHARIGADRY